MSILPIQNGGPWKDKVQAAVDFWFGPDVAPDMDNDGDRRMRMNAIAAELGLPLAGNGESWLSVRAKFNAIIANLFDPAATAFFERMANPPTDEREAAINAVFVALRAADLLGHKIWVLAAADSQAARLCWTDPAYDLVAYNSPSFAADRGFTGDGTAAYLDTGYNHNQVAQDDFSMGVWVLTNVTAQTQFDFGAAERARINTRDHVNVLTGFMNSASAFNRGLGSFGSTSVGHSVVSRDGAETVSIYRNAVLMAPVLALASAAPQPRNFLILGRSSSTVPTNFSTRQVAIAHLGPSMIPEQVTALHDAFQTYLQAIGAIA